MADASHSPSLKSFVIASSIVREMEAQAGGPPRRIPLSCASRSRPNTRSWGCSPPKKRSKSSSMIRPSADDSDFYVFASLFPDDIKKLAELTQWFISSGWTNHLRPSAHFHGHGEGDVLLANI